MSKREKVNSLAVDFQPDAVEIAMRPLPFAARLGVWIGIIFFFGALAASWFCQVDVIVNGTGKLVSAEQNIVMKPLDRTVIRSIDVRVGQVVRKGDCLIKFDPTINKKEEERLKSDMQSIDAQFDRWNAEYSEKEYNPVDPNKDEQIQRMIWIQRNQFFQQVCYQQTYQQNGNHIYSAPSTIVPKIRHGNPPLSYFYIDRKYACTSLH